MGILFVLSGGCTTHMHDLKRDGFIEDREYPSVIVWKIHIIDNMTSGLPQKGFSHAPQFFLEAHGNTAIFGNTVHSGPAYDIEGKWTSTNGVTYYDGWIAAQVEPADYFLSYLFLEDALWSTKIPIKRNVAVPNGTLVYLGCFELELKSRDSENFYSSFRLNADEEDYADTLKKLYARLPAVYDRFRDHITTPTRSASPNKRKADQAIASSTKRTDDFPLSSFVKEIRFFESANESPPHDKRNYLKEFVRAETRFINLELTMRHPRPGNRMDFDIYAVCRRKDGCIFTSEVRHVRIEADWKRPVMTLSWGQKQPGNVWPSDTYTVDIFVKGERIASGTFMVR